MKQGISGDGGDRQRREVLTADLTNAIENHRAGRLERAEALYRKVLKALPSDPDALHLLGVVALERGNPDEAIELIGKALAAVPTSAQGHYNLGNALRAAGRLIEARDSYQHAIFLRPGFGPAHSNLGAVLCELEHFEVAIASCQSAISLDPSSADAHATLANALCRMHRFEAAETSFRRALELSPERTDLELSLAYVLLELRKFVAAAACCRRALERDPSLVGAHWALACSMRSVGEIDAAIAHYRDALALRPDEARIWNDLGCCFLALGGFVDAADAFRRALAIDPNLADAYRNLASCRQLPADDSEMTRIAVLAERTDLPIEDRSAAAFAVAKALDDADRYDEAFVAYESANRLYRAARAATGDFFDAADLASRIDRLISDFAPASFDALNDCGNPSALPVFIVGLPRSGTSLVEQIAASHSRVFGAGELRDISEISAGLGPVDTPWAPAMVRRAADTHLERLRGLGGDVDRVTDKMPDNIFMLGLIAALYPSARIIFCRRDPRDVGLSCFFQKFGAGLLTFSYDLADCGRRIRETERLVAHWHRVLPLRWLDIQYESLVADLEGQSRRLIEFLDLAWEPGCVDFHRTKRAVHTASRWQVRQPLYRRSVGRWRHYERHLRPLLDELGQLMDD
jgi:tetratricopeptide (TPR) repeat protein